MNTVDVSDNQTQNEAVADVASRQDNNGQAIFQFMDSRDAAAAQRKLHAMINNSPRMAAQQEQLDNNISPDIMPIQRMTDIRYGATVNYAYHDPPVVLPGPGMGPPIMNRNASFATEMTADLDLNDPVKGSGTPTGGPEVEARRDTKKKYEGRWVLAHLLNDDLGGLGIPDNLAPFTQDANLEHYHAVESNVKNLLYSQPAGNFALNNAGYVQYRVTVQRPNPWNSAQPNANFQCTWRTQVNQPAFRVDWVPGQGWIRGPNPAVNPQWNEWNEYTVRSRHGFNLPVPNAWESRGRSWRPGVEIPVAVVAFGNWGAAFANIGGPPPAFRPFAQAGLIQNAGTPNARIIGWQL